MKRLGTWLAALLLLSACGGGGGSSSPPRNYDWSQLGTTLDSFISTASDPPTGTVSGYGFVLFNRSGVLYTRAGGNQSLSSVDMIASASKLPAVAAILTLVDQGKLNLDTPVASYFQGAGNPITWPADKAAITTRMLLSHTSGLPGLASTQPACMNEPAATSLQQCAQNIANTALVSKPGAEFNYGGVDYQVAGYLATLLSGASSWQAFFNSAIVTPLGLSTFTYGDPLLVTNPRIAGGAGSDVGDYATILAMVLNNGQYGGKQLLSASSIGQLTSNQIAGLNTVYTPFSAAVAPDYPGYTLGLFISAASLYSAQSSGPEYSDPGLYGTTPWFDTGTGYGAVILINQDTQTGLDIWNAVRPLILQQLTGKAA
jgi:CubicO group peptidase (beta-lactamase class C family)